MTNYLQMMTTNGGQFQFIMLFASFMGGLIASISPCSLGMLPIIIGYVGGYSEERPLKTLLQMFIFICGTSVVFSVIGVVCALTGQVFISYFGSYFALIMASFLMIMGLKLLDILEFEFPVFIKAIPKNKSQNMFIYPFVLGMVFALAGTPCSTPILASIMTFASLVKNLPLAILMLFLFSLGQGFILIIAAVFTSTVKNIRSFAKFSNVLIKLSGALLVVASIYIFYKVFAPLL